MDPEATSFEEALIAIQLPKVYYDFDRASLRNDASEDLQNILEILEKNPELIIEIASHTDSRGRKSYNQRLSFRRAESVVRWLNLRGINRKRLVAKGYGESRPINGCVDGVRCSNAQHQENRRTEFRVIGTLSGGLFPQYEEGR